jgi:hypothetical protein
MYSVEAKSYIIKVARIRRLLIAKHASQKNNTEMVKAISELMLYLNAYNYTDRQMAGFWQKHKNKIYDLIPGEGSGNHNAFIQKFQNLDAQASQY